MVSVRYNDSIFINCPFDKEYMPLFHAIIFTVYRCGFFPVCALEEDDSSNNRLDKIIHCIEKCRYSIHDISRIELSHGFPRFNMPFELGVFFGAKRFGDKEHRAKTALILEREKFTYHRSISDLGGIDTKAHNNDIDILIRSIRDWLYTTSKRKTIPYHPIIQEEYNRFTRSLSLLAKKLKLDVTDILFYDYCQMVEESIRKNITEP